MSNRGLISFDMKATSKTKENYTYSVINWSGRLARRILKEQIRASDTEALYERC